MQLIYNKCTEKITFLLSDVKFDIGTCISLEGDCREVPKGRSNYVVVYDDIPSDGYAFIYKSNHRILAENYFKNEIEALEYLPDILADLDDQLIAWKLTHEV